MSEDDAWKSAQDEVQKALVNVIRTASAIGAEDIDFFRASNPSGGKELDKQSARLLDIAKGLLKSATTGTDLSVPRLRNYESVDDKWQGIVEVIDNLLEKADVALDEYTGVIKKLTPAQEQQAPTASSAASGARKTHFGPKPQLQFAKPPSNDETTAFKPLLRTKPNAVVPLEKSLETETTESGLAGFQHPYQEEIDQYQYPARVHEQAEPIPFKAFEGEATFVDTPEGVAEMLEELRQAKEIAIDLEHHDKHSYIGLVSLMQISTRDKDWIVDTLKPWREDLQVLNEVFTDPNIVKVCFSSAASRMATDEW
jgi:exosome complex exonuclease RRP6